MDGRSKMLLPIALREGEATQERIARLENVIRTKSNNESYLESERRYWNSRALAAEAKVAELEAQLRASRGE